MTITHGGVSPDGMWGWRVFITDLCVRLHTDWAKLLQRDGGARRLTEFNELSEKHWGWKWGGSSPPCQSLMSKHKRNRNPTQCRVNISQCTQVSPPDAVWSALSPEDSLSNEDLISYFLSLQHFNILFYSRTFFFFLFGWFPSFTPSLAVYTFSVSRLCVSDKGMSGNKQMSLDGVGVLTRSWQAHRIPNDQDSVPHYESQTSEHSFQPEGMCFAHGSKPGSFLISFTKCEHRISIDLLQFVHFHMAQLFTFIWKGILTIGH